MNLTATGPGAETVTFQAQAASAQIWVNGAALHGRRWHSLAVEHYGYQLSHAVPT